MVGPKRYRDVAIADIAISDIAIMKIFPRFPKLPTSFHNTRLKFYLHIWFFVFAGARWKYSTVAPLLFVPIYRVAAAPLLLAASSVSGAIFSKVALTTSTFTFYQSVSCGLILPTDSEGIWETSSVEFCTIDLTGLTVTRNTCSV